MDMEQNMNTNTTLRLLTGRPTLGAAMWLAISSLTSHAQLVSSTFDTGNEEWRVVRRSYSSFKVTKIVDPGYAFGGNPGGCLANGDGAYDYYFRAPSKFLGDQSSAMGGRLEFDLSSDLVDAPAPPDYSLIIAGGGMTHYLQKRTAISSRSLLANRWVRFSIGLNAEAGWMNASTGRPSTANELAACLGSLEMMDINGEFAGGGDVGRLDNVQLFSTPETPVVIAGPITNPANGHAYFLLSESTWPAAEQKAQSLGGHLVSINSSEEQAWVTSIFASFGGVNRSLWIGLNDIRILGTHEWSNGDATPYRNWRDAEPNTFYGINHCVRIIGPAYNDPGYWVVDTTITSGIHGIVEVTPGTAVELNITSALRLAWPTQTTNRYQVQTSANVGSGDWKNFGEAIHGNGSPASLFTVPTNDGVQIFRVLSLPSN